MHKKKGISDTFLGNLTEGILTRCNTTTLIYKPIQPLATIKRHLIVLPEHSEKEIGVPFWLIKVWNIAINTGAPLMFLGSGTTLNYIKALHYRYPVESEFIVFKDWNNFLHLKAEVKKDDNLIIVLSRREHASYHSSMKKIPNYLNKYFRDTNFILIYPVQTGVSGDSIINFRNPSLLEPFKDNLARLDAIGKTLAGLFRKS